MASGDVRTIAGQAQGADGFIWWNTVDGAWIRSDIVNESGPCESVPVVSAPAPPAVPDPAATEEVSS